MNRYGTELSPKYYTQPDPDSLELPLIKTPVYVNSINEIADITYSTQTDATQSCPKCQAESPTISATIGPPNYDQSHWHCIRCNHRWDTHRGIFINQRLF